VPKGPLERRTDVLIVGAGPVGLWLAAELRLAGTSVTVVERREVRSPHSRALTVHARTLEIFASRGIADAWLQQGVRIPTGHYAMLSTRLDLSGVDSPFPFALFIPQARTEEIIEAHAVALGARLLRGGEVTAVHADQDGVFVDATGVDGQRTQFSSRYLVGCDGRRSVVREAAGIGFSGTAGTISCVLGDVVIEDEGLPPALSMQTVGGSFYGVQIGDGRYRLIGIDHATMSTPRKASLDFKEFRTIIRRVAGTDFGMCKPSWLTRVASATFQADEYRRGCVLLAGDAAHVHFPMGGQGMNLGIHDAMNLGWKLGAVVAGAAPETLLDSYHFERAPISKDVIEDTLAQTAVVSMPGREGQALRAMISTALTDNAALNKTFARFASGVGVKYQSDSRDHPLVGHRVPNCSLTDGTDVFAALRPGKVVLLGIDPETLAKRLGGNALRMVSAKRPHARLQAVQRGKRLPLPSSVLTAIWHGLLTGAQLVTQSASTTRSVPSCGCFLESPTAKKSSTQTLYAYNNHEQ